MELPPDEAERLAALIRYGVLDTDFEPCFDRLTRLASRLFGTPIALISLIDQNRQWFKAATGVSVRSTPRDVAFCSHAILGDDVFIVPDAEADARFNTNPLVTGDPNVRFYAGAPLRTPEGYNLGTFCVIDTNARSDLGPEDQSVLKDFADTVIELLELRSDLRAARRARTDIDKSLERLRPLCGEVPAIARSVETLGEASRRLHKELG